MKKFLKNILNKLFFYYYEKDIFLKGIILSNINKNKKKINNLSCVEFSAFSQWGEDGIIDWLISQFKYIPKTFIEFGVGDYLESNTRFLYESTDSEGLIIDNFLDLKYLEEDLEKWKGRIKLIKEWVNSENINLIFFNVKQFFLSIYFFSEIMNRIIMNRIMKTGIGGGFSIKLGV
jgi:hypothetical protein